MSSIKLSSNYQVVIPKAVRQKLGLHKGQVLYVQSVGDKSVALTTESPVDKYYGILKDAWTEDALDYQRSIRDDRDLPELWLRLIQTFLSTHLMLTRDLVSKRRRFWGLSSQSWLRK